MSVDEPISASMMNQSNDLERQIENAAAYKKFDVLEELLKQNSGARISRSAMISVIDDERILDLFLKNNADPNVEAEDRRARSKGRKGNGFFLPQAEQTVLEAVAVKGNLSIIKKLIEHGADPKIGNVLHWAASVPSRVPSGVEVQQLQDQPPPPRDSEETLDILRYLVEEVDLEVEQHDDMNNHLFIGRPLHWAARFPGTEKTIEFLLDHGADRAGRTARGETPYDCAKNNGNKSPEISKLLREVEGEVFLPSDQYADNWFEPVSWAKGAVVNGCPPRPPAINRIWNATLGRFI